MTVKRTPTDLSGRTAEQIRASIRHKEIVIELRLSYPSTREGYTIRTREIMRDLDIDREQLAEIESGIDPKIPDERSLRGDALRRWRNNLLWLTRHWD